MKQEVLFIGFVLTKMQFPVTVGADCYGVPDSICTILGKWDDMVDFKKWLPGSVNKRRFPSTEITVPFCCCEDPCSHPAVSFEGTRKADVLRWSHIAAWGDFSDLYVRIAVSAISFRYIPPYGGFDIISEQQYALCAIATRHVRIDLECGLLAANLESNISWTSVGKGNSIFFSDRDRSVSKRRKGS